MVVLISVFDAAACVFGDLVPLWTCMEVAVAVLASLKTNRLNPEDMFICFEECDVLSTKTPFLTKLMSIKASRHADEERQRSKRLRKVCPPIDGATRVHVIFLIDRGMADLYECNGRKFEVIVPSWSESYIRPELVLSLCKTLDRITRQSEDEELHVTGLLNLTKETSHVNFAVTSSLMQHLADAAIASSSIMQKKKSMRLLNKFCEQQFMCFATRAKVQRPLAVWRYHPEMLTLQRLAYLLILSDVWPNPYTGCSMRRNLIWEFVAFESSTSYLTAIDRDTGRERGAISPAFANYAAALHDAAGLPENELSHSQKLAYVETAMAIPFRLDDAAVFFARSLLGSRRDLPSRVFLGTFTSYYSRKYEGPLREIDLATFLLVANSRYYQWLQVLWHSKNVIVMASCNKSSVIEVHSYGVSRLFNFVEDQLLAPPETIFENQLLWNISWPDSGMPPLSTNYTFLYVKCAGAHHAISFLHAANKSGLRVSVVYLVVPGDIRCLDIAMRHVAIEKTDSIDTICFVPEEADGFAYVVFEELEEGGYGFSSKIVICEF